QIWRCYHAWGQSFRVIAVPLILLVAECSLFVAAMILNVKFSKVTSDANAILFNNILSALTFVSLGTTVITTFLIGYRIYYASRLNSGSPSKRLFNRIAVMIIESAAAYSFVLILDAIFTAVPSSIVVASPLDIADDYVENVLLIVAVRSFHYLSNYPASQTYNQGMAPTVLVARTALVNPNSTEASTTITHMSGLKFESQQGGGGGQSGNDTQGGVNESTHTDNTEPTPVIELKRQSSADAPSGDNQV
ncbi:hypothetical protein CVT25_002778, partial [Psilocybe cyanescens]